MCSRCVSLGVAVNERSRRGNAHRKSKPVPEGVEPIWGDATFGIVVYIDLSHGCPHCKTTGNEDQKTYRQQSEYSNNWVATPYRTGEDRPAQKENTACNHCPEDEDVLVHLSTEMSDGGQKTKSSKASRKPLPAVRLHRLVG